MRVEARLTENTLHYYNSNNNDNNKYYYYYCCCCCSAAAAATAGNSAATKENNGEVLRGTAYTNGKNPSIAACFPKACLENLVTERTEGRRARRHQRLKYLYSLCALWKDNVSPTRLIRSLEDRQECSGIARSATSSTMAHGRAP